MLYRSAPRPQTGKRGGYKRVVLEGHNNMAERCDMSAFEKRSQICKALDALDRAVRETLLPAGNPYKELAIITLKKGEEGNIAIYHKGETSRRRAEEKAAQAVENTRLRLVREGNAPPVEVTPDPLKTALIRLLKACRKVERKGHPLLSEAQAIASFSPEEATEYFTNEERAIKICHHVANTLTA